MQSRWRTTAFNALLATAALALTACASEGGDTADPASPEAPPGQEQEQTQELAGDSIGTLTIDGTSFELTESQWCREETDGGADEEVLRVGARNADESVVIFALEVVSDDSAAQAYQQVEALAPVDEVTEFHSEHVLEGMSAFPYLVVDGHNISIEDNEMWGYGPDGNRETYDMAAHFTVSGEPDTC